MSFISFNKERRFKDFSQAVQFCSLCTRLTHRIKVFSESNGNINTKVLFVAEAPGRLGADRTGIPLYGDKTGDNFELLLKTISWKREDIFITNAILCNPRTESGVNSTPNQTEINNCSAYLEMTIKLINPEVIVSLGRTALIALANVNNHNYSFTDVGKPVPFGDRVLVPLYHPGPRALVHRSFAAQTSDFIKLASFVDPNKGIKEKKNHFEQYKPSRNKADQFSRFHQLVYLIVSNQKHVNLFKLTKLLYLIELHSLYKKGHMITQGAYLRFQDGPWNPKLNEIIDDMKGWEISIRPNRTAAIYSIGPSPRIDISIEDEYIQIVNDVIEKFGHLTNQQIKTAVYSTSPMKYILRQEKFGRDMRRKPVLYKDKTIETNDS